MWCWITSFTVEEVTSLIQAITVVVVAIPAFKGINSWRRQLLGKKKIELAEEALVLVYELESAITWARHPLSYSGEGQDRPNRENEPEARQRLNDSYYSRISRLNESSDEFAKFRKTGILFRAYFGDEAQDAFTDFMVVRNQISSAVGMLINHVGENDYPRDLRQRHEDTIWDHSTEEGPDEIRRKIEEAVIEIERVCKPILQKQ